MAIIIIIILCIVRYCPHETFKQLAEARETNCYNCLENNAGVIVINDLVFLFKRQRKGC